MITKDLDLHALRPRFVTVMSALGGWLRRRSPQRTVDPALSAHQAMIRPSPHERVAIEAHREDRL
jgi:hypothetical protein